MNVTSEFINAYVTSRKIEKLITINSKIIKTIQRYV